MRFQNVYSLFRAQAAKYRGAPVFYTRDGGGESWKSQNWEDFEEQVHAFACALLAKGLTNGASVAILAGNVPEWTIVDIATIAAGERATFRPRRTSCRRLRQPTGSTHRSGSAGL